MQFSVGRFREFFGLERNILVLLVAIVLLALGEELWISFVPNYLEVLGAGVFVWAGCRILKDLLDAVYQYPGGILTDLQGQSRTPIIFNLLAISGYLM